MARKLIDQDEAARMLGITTEQVSLLRDRKKLFPYRDGDQWKYKEEDIQRYREEMQGGKAAEPAADEEPPVWNSRGDSLLGKDLGAVEAEQKDSDDIDVQVGDEIDSILLSEVELGKSSTEEASTIIGKPDEGPADDLDLTPSTIQKGAVPLPKAEPTIALDDDADLLAASAAAPGGSMVVKTESSLTLPRVGDSKNVLTSSDSSVAKDAGSSGFSLVGDSSLASFADVKLVPSEEGEKTGSSDKLFGSDALQLSDNELKLMDSPSATQVPAKSADGGKKTSSGSSIKLGDEELEVVLGGSKSGSDVTQSPTDSGIQLISASDSGLSLDQPVAMGSSARRLLDMPGEGTSEELALEAPVEPLKADDDFLLTAMDDTGGEESSDSGSQVIALDTDEEMSSAMFAPAGSGAGLLEEETAAGSLGGAGMLAPTSAFGVSPTLMGAAGVSGGVAAAPSEARYSTANITVLSVCVVLLMLCGMMTFDLMRNMWSWDGPYTVNSSILESIGKTVGWMEK